MKKYEEKLVDDIELKSRVKVNLYKTLLEEEKHKNKRNTTIGLSLFIVGIVSTSTLYKLDDHGNLEKQNLKSVVVNNIETKKSVPNYRENTDELDIFNKNIIDERKLSNIKEEDFFVSDFRM